MSYGTNNFTILNNRAAAHSLYELQLLRESLPEKHRNIRHFHGDELSDDVSRQSARRVAGKLARGRSRQVAGG